MKDKQGFTKFLAISGTLLVWFPIFAPILLTSIFLLTRGIFRFDYLMPAELFPAALVGGGLLLWAALRKGSRLNQIGWGVGIAVLTLVGSQVLAVVTGLASGKTEPVGLWYVLVLGLLVVYILAVVTIGIGGVLLLSDLFRTQDNPPVSSEPEGD